MLPSEADSGPVRAPRARLANNIRRAAERQRERIGRSNDLCQIALLLMASSADRMAAHPGCCLDCGVPFRLFSDGPFGTIYRCPQCHDVMMVPTTALRSEPL